jgi:hypothetical protein
MRLRFPRSWIRVETSAPEATHDERPAAALPRRAMLLGLAAMAFGTTACGYLKANFARTYVLERELDAYVFKKPLEEVWRSVTSVHGPGGALFWDGTTFRWEDVTPTLKRTSPRTEKQPGGSATEYGSTTTFYEVEGAVLPGGCAIRYREDSTTTTFRSGQKSENHSVNRRLDLELELVRMFDPETAARIEAAAEEGARSGEWYPPKPKT